MELDFLPQEGLLSFVFFLPYLLLSVALAVVMYHAVAFSVILGTVLTAQNSSSTTSCTLRGLPLPK